MSKLWKRLHCLLEGHRDVWLRNIYGDEINHVGGRRSVWMCTFCGRVKYRRVLHGGAR
jgi:hypothetical protein